jgi:hypothetical protein
LEPIDLYGNWQVTDLLFQPPAKPYGLQEELSKFKIRNKGSSHYLIKKRSVGWNGRRKAIRLTEVTRAEPVLFNGNMRLVAKVRFARKRYEVSFGSDDNGVTLKIQVIPSKKTRAQGFPGGTGTAGRGG